MRGATDLFGCVCVLFGLSSWLCVVVHGDKLSRRSCPPLHSPSSHPLKCRSSKKARRSSRSSITITTDPTYQAIHPTDRCTSKGMVGCLRRANFLRLSLHNARSSIMFREKRSTIFCGPVAHDPSTPPPHTTTGLVTSSRSRSTGAAGGHVYFLHRLVVSGSQKVRVV